MGSWKTDNGLVTNLEKYVSQYLTHKEILDFMKKDYHYYPWSLAILARRSHLQSLFLEIVSGRAHYKKG